jgi:hypothetical protein
MLLLFIPTLVLVLATDASKMYHSVRGQDTIKLYVIFNALEVGHSKFPRLMPDRGPTLLRIRAGRSGYAFCERDPIALLQKSRPREEAAAGSAIFLLRLVSRLCLGTHLDLLLHARLTQRRNQLV